MPGLAELRRAVAAQVQLAVELPETLLALNRSVRTLADTLTDTLAATREAALGLQRASARAEAVLDQVEPALTALLPGVTRAAEVLRDPGLAGLLEGLADSQRRLAAITAATERFSSLVDDAGGRLAGLPGAALLARGLFGPAGREEPPPPR